MFPYLTKIIEIGLRWAAIIPFSVVPCLDTVDFYAFLTPVLSLTINEDNSDRSKTNMDTGNWLYYTTLTNLALSSIERPELSFDFGCWTRGGVIFGICLVIGWNVPAKRRLIGCVSYQLALPLSNTNFDWFVLEDVRRTRTIGNTCDCYMSTPKPIRKSGVSRELKIFDTIAGDRWCH